MGQEALVEQIDELYMRIVEVGIVRELLCKVR